MSGTSISLQRPLPRYLRLLVPIWIFSAFLSGVKFIPGISNNIGPFEAIGSVTIGLVFLREAGERQALAHPVMRTLLFINILAAISLLQVPANRLFFCVLQVVILVFLIMYLLLSSNPAIIRQPAG